MTAILDGSKWGNSQIGTSGGTVTFSIADAGERLTPFDISALSRNGFAEFPFDIVARIREAFAAWSDVANIDFVHIVDPGGAAGSEFEADIRIFFAPIPGNTIGLAFFPRFGAISGDIVIDTSLKNDQQDFFLTVLHEIGHSIGFEHNDGDSILFPQIGGADSLTPLDVEGAQRLYGAQDNVLEPLEFNLFQDDLEILDAKNGLRVIGNGRDNEIFGSGANETLEGGRGEDLLIGGGGNDVLRGGDDDDELVLTGIGGRAEGGAGTDTLRFDSDAGVLVDLQFAVTRPDGQRADTASSIEIVIATEFADQIRGNQSSNMIEGGNGNDILSGRNGNDTLDGGEGSDSLFGNSGSDMLFASAGADLIDGGFGIDTLSFDEVRQRVQADLIGELAGINDAAGDVYLNIENIVGSDFNDHLRGDENANIIEGGRNDDTLYGRQGNDQLFGGSGADFLAGNTGRDVLTGGSGSDTFFFAAVGHSARGFTNRDKITDFRRDLDVIRIDRIDADTTQGGNQAFEFIGDSSFSGTAGELRSFRFQPANVTLIYGDVDGDFEPDFELVLSGQMVLEAENFLL